jgi:hypothetical protein
MEARHRFVSLARTGNFVAQIRSDDGRTSWHVEGPAFERNFQPRTSSNGGQVGGHSFTPHFGNESAEETRHGLLSRELAPDVCAASVKT